MRLLAPLVLAALLAPALSAQAQGEVVELQVEGPITKATKLYLEDGLRYAERTGAPALILRMNTPGGGLEETLAMTDLITNSPVPILGYVAPRTATAWSAGTVLLLSTHVAAMAPFSLIGSSQPVELGGGGFTPINDSKIINALVGKLRALAASHGRNETAAEEFVTKNLNLNADEALRANVIELVAPDEAALLRAADGRMVETVNGNVTLRTSGVPVRVLEPSVRVAVLDIFYNPLIAGLLMLVGIYALIFGLGSPGFGAEFAGVVLILLALVGLGFNVSWIGIALIALGAGLLLFELHVGQGVLGLAGVAILILGTLFLAPLGPAGPGQGWSFPAEYQRQVLFILAVPSVLLAGFLLFAMVKVGQARRRKPFLGRMEGEEAEVTEALGPGRAGFVRYQGEVWQATSDWELHAGERVVIRGKDGPVLRVEPREARPRAGDATPH